MGQVVRYLLIAFALLLPNATASAQEFDLPKFYIGGQIGYSWDNIDFTTAPPGVFGSPGNFGGVIGGVHGGADLVQQGPVIFGIVADFNWLSADTGSQNNQTAAPIVILNPDEESTTIINSSLHSQFDLDLQWKSSIRGTAGLFVAPNLFLYTTAGIAFARMNAQVSQTATTTISVDTFPPTVTTFTATASSADGTTLTGLVVGGGVQSRIAPNTGLFFQVLYYDFGSETLNLAGSTANVDLSETVAQVGLSFYLN